MMRDLAKNFRVCSINTATFGFQKPIRETVDLIARSGFGHCAPWRNELEGESVRAVAKHIRDSGLRVTGYCRSFYLPASDDRKRKKAIADNKKMMEDAFVLGAEYFPLVAGSLPEGSKSLADARKQVMDALPELLQHAKAIGIKIAIEPMHPVFAADRGCFNTLGHVLDICDAIEGQTRTPHLGALFDVYHTWWDPNLHYEIARAGSQNRIFGFHVNDWLNPTKNILSGRGMMGDGVIDIRGIRGIVEGAGYNGPIEVEIFSEDHWWKTPPEETVIMCIERLHTVV
jgi:sugar phosphate isomerase/epimerase